MQRELRERARPARRACARGCSSCRRALAVRLIELYKADPPDAITVVLESDGFADLLDRTEFMQRISQPGREGDAHRREAKADATATAKRLNALEQREQRIAAADRVRARRGVRVRVGLVDRRDTIENARSTKSRCCAARATAAPSSRTTSRSCRPSRPRSRPGWPASPGPMSAGPVKPGSGGLIWPVNGTITSPFCERAPGSPATRASTSPRPAARRSAPPRRARWC